MKIFQWPTQSACTYYCACVLFVTATDVLFAILMMKLGKPVRLFEPTFRIYLVVMTVTLFTTEQVSSAITWGFLIWIAWGRNFPWGGWKKKLAAKLSSLTEVAKAALQRQTTEAFS